MLERIDHEQRLYVYTVSDEYYSCCGFDYAYNMTKKVATWCGLPSPDPDLVGTSEGYQDYLNAMSAGARYAASQGERCDAELHPQLIGLEGEYVRVTNQEGESYGFRVGKSTGWMPCHLEMESTRFMDDDDFGGPSVDSRPFQTVRVVSGVGY